WNYTNANNRRANYTNLEFGTYNFKVKSTNNDGKWEDLNTNLYIHIKTPFIFTWVAYVIYVLVFILVTIYFTNYSVMKYTTKEKILLENEHNQQLHQLDELRTRFFINISHDLRTPLTLISEPLKVILKDKGLKAEIRNRLNLAHRNVQKLRYITEQLLDISKAEAGKLTFKPKKGDFITFIRFESTHFTDAVKSKGLVLNMHTEYHSIICNFDSDMISKIFFNLLSNAIKYTKEGEIIVRIGQVSKLSLEKLKDSIYSDYILLEIQDSGKGIDQEDIEKVFDRFYQGSVKDVKGYGIGLSHCKDLVEAHAGHIEASSEPDHGTTFRVFIPKIDAITDLTSEDVIQTNAPKLFNEDIHDVDNYKDQQEASNQKKILIIEDDSDMRNFISDELNHHFNVIVAQDGLEGLELVEKHAPELIISDIMMPHMDGIEFCRRIKSDLETSHIPMILLTAKGDSNTRYESIETGADDYIPKPFEIEYLILRIKNLLKSKDQIRQAFQSTSDLKPLSVAVTSLDKKFISELMAAMEEGIPDPEFTVNTLEFKMGMSHTNFYRKIKSLTGKSGKEILMDMRMKRAKQILTDGEGIRISEVAYSVGFSNPKYFSKCFKEYYGVLPSDL
ncbi:MAG: response regulator, partial [Cyclobacteriaceae bacterium]